MANRLRAPPAPARVPPPPPRLRSAFPSSRRWSRCCGACRPARCPRSSDSGRRPAGLSVVESVVVLRSTAGPPCLLRTMHASGLPHRTRRRRRSRLPCHGSRYGPDGTVAAGPATRPLRPSGSSPTRLPADGSPVPPERPLPAAAASVSTRWGRSAISPRPRLSSLRCRASRSPSPTNGDGYGSIATMLLANPGRGVLPQPALLGRPGVPGPDAAARLGPPARPHRTTRRPRRVAAACAHASAAGVRDAVGLHAAWRRRRAPGASHRHRGDSAGPAAGPAPGAFVFGAAERLDVIYVQHAATATIVVWLFIIEHARRVWPRAGRSWWYWSRPARSRCSCRLACTTGSIRSSRDRGISLGCRRSCIGRRGLLSSCWPASGYRWGRSIAIRVIGPTGRRPGRRARFSSLVVVYCGTVRRGGVAAGRELDVDADVAGWRGKYARGLPVRADAEARRRLPIVMGRPEGCLVCHKGVTGLGNSHRPDAVGCASCHGGDLLTLDKARAHAGMDVFAGNLATAVLRCGQVACHPTIVPRVERSVMTTMSGIIAVNRTVFGETPPRSAAGSPHVRRLGQLGRRPHLAPALRLLPSGRAQDRAGPERRGHARRRLQCLSPYLQPGRARRVAPIRARQAARPGVDAPPCTRRSRSTSTTASVSAVTAGRAASRPVTRVGTRCTNRPPRHRSRPARAVAVPDARRRACLRACDAGHPSAARPRLYRLPHVERGHGRRRRPRPQEPAAAGLVRGLPRASRHDLSRCPRRASIPSRARSSLFASGLVRRPVTSCAHRRRPAGQRVC